MDYASRTEAGTRPARVASALTDRSCSRMTATAPPEFERGETSCSYHPSVLTRLRCSRCGKPICPRCGVRTPVGLRCPDCAGVRGLPTYRTNTSTLALSAVTGLGIAALVGVAWGFLPDWGFYLSLLLGFGGVEAMARISKGKRGADLQLVAIVMVLAGVAVSRAVMAQRYGISLEQINALSDFVLTDQVFEEFRQPVSVTTLLRLALVPDLLYVGVALAIAWVRFR